MVRARWWREVEKTLGRLQGSGKAAYEVAASGLSWRDWVKVNLESKVAYPTREEWRAFDAQTGERLRQKQIADKALKDAEKARQEAQQQEQLRRKTEEEAKLRKSREWQALQEKVQKAMQESDGAIELLRQTTERLREQPMVREQDEKEQRQDDARSMVGKEPVPSKQENEDQRQVDPKPEPRRNRKVRI
jgi:hypothetical protein